MTRSLDALHHHHRDVVFYRVILTEVRQGTLECISDVLRRAAFRGTDYIEHALAAELLAGRRSRFVEPVRADEDQLARLQ
jgi:hypothetical protein